MCQTQLLACLGTSSPFFLANTSKLCSRIRCNTFWPPLVYAIHVHCTVLPATGLQVVMWPVKCEKSVSILPIWSVAVWEDDVGDSHLDHKGKAKTMTEKLTLKLPTSTILTVSGNKPLLSKLLVATVVPTKHHDSITSRQRTDLVPDPSLTHKIKSRRIRDLRKC